MPAALAKPGLARTTAVEMLEKLADELSHRGLLAAIQVHPGRIPCLEITNPESGAPYSEEHTVCAFPPDNEGFWWFWWLWAARIAQADDVALAADTIVRVLAVRRSD